MLHAAVQANPRCHVTFAPYGSITLRDLRADTQNDLRARTWPKTGASHEAHESADRESREDHRPDTRQRNPSS